MSTNNFQAIVAQFQFISDNYSEQPAILFKNQSISYQTFKHQVNQFSNYLTSISAHESGYIGICLPRSPELMVAIMSAINLGIKYIPFDIEYPQERLAHMATVSGVKNIITLSGLKNQLPDGNFKPINFDEINFDAIDSNFTPISNVNDAGYVLFTSGSTGLPKGVEMSHAALCNLINWQVKESKMQVGHKTLQFAPVSFDVHFQEIFSTWCVGGCICLIEDTERLNVNELKNYLVTNRINRLFLPFIALQTFCDFVKDSSSTFNDLLEIVTAGEQLQITPAIRSFFEKNSQCKLFNHYGPTETHVVTSYQLPNNVQEWPLLPPIGNAISNVHCVLLDENGNRVNKGMSGELYVSGLCLSDGYINNKSLTNERFITLDKEKSILYYKTGDVVKEDEHGNLVYEGRIDGQVKVRGYRIELGEIEVVALKQEGVSQSAAMVREDIPGERKIVLYIVTEQQKNIGEIRKHLSIHLPQYMLPSNIVFVPLLPRTPSGKIDRRALPAPSTERPDLGNSFVKPSTTLEISIAKLWSSLLQIDQVGVYDNFFELGGNSLLAMQLIVALEKECSIKIPIIKIYQYPTIKKLVEFLDGTNSSENFHGNKNRFEQKNKQVNQAIAIVGMSVRTPGANSIDSFWNLLKEGKEAITFFDEHTLSKELDSECLQDVNYIKARGIIDDAEGFDAAFFGISPLHAQVTDPQHRVFLEVCWNALEHAGTVPEKYDGLIGVFAGTGNNTYFQNNVSKNKQAIDKAGAFLTMTFNEKDYIATRVAYLLNLKGLAVSVHTGCSTSLTAVVQAMDALQQYQCDTALAGGVSITSPINSGQRYEEGAMFSNDGHTRTFDAMAKGTVFSDGAGCIVMKRMDDAIKDGDTIYAIIKGGALNNDGGDKGSFTAPSVYGQASVINAAQESATVSSRSISYIEAHGTATPLGDPIEIEGLTKAFQQHTNDKQFCAIGSVKSNIGHLTAAAGVIGLIKTTLALHYKLIPASINYNAPNPQIAFAETPFFVNDKLRPWDTDQLPRRAGVSSFGVGGTNAHVILEEAIDKPDNSSSRKYQLITLSAKSVNALTARKNELMSFIEDNKNVNIEDIAYTLQVGRTALDHKYFQVVSGNEDLISLLNNNSSKYSSTTNKHNKCNGVGFMFPGQGAQYVGMGKNLYDNEPVFRQAFEQCISILNNYLSTDLKKIIFGTGNISEDELLLKKTIYTQPALFTIGYSLAQLWMSWGIFPKVLIGHSIGEFVAATLAEVFTLEDALKIISNRGILMQSCKEGSMLSVRLSEDEATKYLLPETSIAAVNSSQLCVIAGPTPQISQIQQQLENKEIVCKQLHTSHAFHSPMMDEIVQPFKDCFKGIVLNAPKIPIVSTVTKLELKAEEATDINYWSNHLRATVRFSEGVQSLWNQFPGTVLLELGPRNSATTLARQQAKENDNNKAYSSLGDTSIDNAELKSMLMAIGNLWQSDVLIDWNAYYFNENRNKIALPTYPFEHKRFWLDAIPTNNSSIQQPIYNTFNEQQINIENTVSTMDNRKENIIEEIKSILEESSGLELKSASIDATFNELGLDSLFLTSIALTLTKQYNCKITFRQLNESLYSIGLLSTYIDEQLPKESVNRSNTPTPSVVNQNIAPTTVANVQFSGDIQSLLQQQLMLMQQQLMILQGGQGTANFNASKPIHPALTASPSAPKVVPSEELQELKKPFGAVARIEKTNQSGFSPKQNRWLSIFIEEYIAKTIRSKEYTQQHRKHLADPRVVTGFKPHLKEVIYQPVVNRSLGARIWDIDKNEYIDILNGFGSNMFGHSPNFIVAAIEEQLKKGYELGPQHELAGEVAEMICKLTGFDRAGLCNTGSEAVLGAMRIARTVTGRSTIVSFNGSYHGINDEVIVRGSKKLKPIPASAGILQESVSNMLVIDYGSEESIEQIRKHKENIAAILVEPVQSRRADFQPKEYLQQLRKIADEIGALLIFDEVITGFRILGGGAQAYFDVKADIGTYGKVVGGGMPIGVIAGKQAYMDALDGGHWQYGDQSVPEVGVTYFAGTFVRHPFALAAAKASLKHMIEKGDQLQHELTSKTTYLVNDVNTFCREAEIPFALVNFGSLFKPKYSHDLSNIDLLYLLLRFKGIHVYDGFPCFITEAHTQKDIETIAKTFKESLKELIDAGFIEGTIPFNNTHTFSNTPPLPGAKLGLAEDGSEQWFIPNPDEPGKYLQINFNQ